MGRNYSGDLQADRQQHGREMRQIRGQKRPAEGASGSDHGGRPRRTFNTARWQRPTRSREWWFHDGTEPAVEGVDFAFDTQDGPGEDLIFLSYSNEEGDNMKIFLDDGEMVADSLAPEVDANQEEVREENKGVVERKGRLAFLPASTRREEATWLATMLASTRSEATWPVTMPARRRMEDSTWLATMPSRIRSGLALLLASRRSGPVSRSTTNTLTRTTWDSVAQRTFAGEQEEWRSSAQSTSSTRALTHRSNGLPNC